MKTYILFLRSFLILTFFFSFLMMHFAPLVHAQDGDFVWAKSMGGATLDEGYAITVDSAGNVYTTGYFQDAVDFDPGAGTTTLTSVGNNDIFISKLSPGGDLIWARSFGSTKNDEGWGIAVDSSGNVYTTGYYQNIVDFDPGAGTANLTSIGSSDIFISKLDSNGDFLGAWSMGGTADDYGYGIFVDSSGNIYTTGYFKFTVDFDPSTGGTSVLTSVGDRDVFISKLDTNGSFVWATGFGGASADVGLGIALYSSGNVYATGWFKGSVDFGMFNLVSHGIDDIYISKLDSDTGDFIWARGMGGTSSDVGQAVTVDTAGNVYSTGWFNGTADFDPGPGTFNLLNSAQFGADVFISKLDVNGNFVWAKGMGGTVSESGYGIALDASGNVYSTGSFGGTADFDPGLGVFNLTSSGGTDIFISKLTNAGDFVWAKAMGGALDDSGYDISIDASGNVHTTGFFKDTVDFDPGDTGTFNLTSAGFEDIFISKLSGEDSFPWLLFLPAIIRPPVI
jgi:hypothetical protein